MELKLEQYRVFNTVAECGGVSSAAEKLFVTQSAVSQNIKSLENALGVTLFKRTPRGITLTEQGEVLYSYTSAALELIEAGNHRLEAFGTLDEGELKIGAGDTISSYYLLPLLESFHREYPGLKIRVINRVTTEAVELVKKGAIDLAFGNLPVEDESLEVIKCLDVHDVFVAGKGFEELRDKVLSRKEVSELPLILLEKKSNSRNYIDAEFLNSGYRLNADIELGAHELLLQFAKIGLGVSCVTREFASKYIEDGDVFELNLKKPIPPRAIGCFYSKKIELSAAAARFASMIDL